MAWVVPAYSKSRVDAAGVILRETPTTYTSYEELSKALEVLSNWRGSHSFPLNTFQTGLRRRARQIDRNAIVAQRLKRVPSIVAKLERIRGMQLSRMQDIGGCRAVLETVDQVIELRDSYLKSSIKHRRVSHKDYIAKPKHSGYRGVHLVYRYASDKKETYNGHLVELRLRSRLQHAWATAVEIVGTFLDQSLKASEGSEQWLHFFALTGSAFALLENRSPVDGHPAPDQLLAQIRSLRQELDVTNMLNTYRHALTIPDIEEQGTFHYYLLTLRPQEARLDVEPFRADDLPKASATYLEREREVENLPGVQAVLVAADSLYALKRLYPNYFLDTEVFLQALLEVLN